ncbi:MAG: DUF2157 domain-containing protein [Saprospiraceae bacterium]|nr:DUF2157 domain-containing protein [Saprospiraceae bacterium]
MSNEKPNFKTLASKVQNWLDHGLISKEQAEQILAFEQGQSNNSKTDWGNIIASALGALLIGGGIILIFAYNWESFSKFTKLIVSFLPLIVGQLIYGFTYFKRAHSSVWVETSSAFLALSLIACISLISQTYHIIGAATDFVFLLLLLGIPILFLLPNALTIALYMVGSTYWSLWDESWSNPTYWFFLGIILVAMWRFSDCSSSRLRKIILSWLLALSFPLAWLGMHLDASLMYFILGFSFCIGIYYLIELFDYPSRPFKTLAVIGVLIMSIVLTFLYKWETERPILAFIEDGQWNVEHFVINIALVFFGVYYLWLLFQKRKGLEGSTSLIAIFPIIVTVLYPLGAMNLGTFIFLAMNAYLIVLGIFLIKEGMDTSSISLVNLGLFILLLLGGIRFLDSNWSLLVKGIAFLSLGILAFIIRWQLNKKIKTY